MPITEKPAIDEAQAIAGVKAGTYTIRNPVKILPAPRTAKGQADPSYGIVITVPDPTTITFDNFNSIVPDPNYPGRAVIFPPGSIAGVPPLQYNFVAYVRSGQQAQVYIPSVADGVLFADLPNGPLTPVGAPPGYTLFDAISDAIDNQIQPLAPDHTG